MTSVYHRRRVETVSTPRFRSRPPGPDVGPFAVLMERWRRTLGLSNRAFARHTALAASGRWCSGASSVSDATKRAVLSKAEGSWRTAFEQALLSDLLARPTDAA
jgi:hypothetical protein